MWHKKPCFIYTSEKTGTARRSPLFIALTFENYKRYLFLFFYEILVLSKNKNTNVYCFF